MPKQIGIGIPGPPPHPPTTLDHALTPAVCASAAASHTLGQLIITSEQVDGEIDRAVFLIRALEVELALGHAARGSRSREGAK